MRANWETGICFWPPGHRDQHPPQGPQIASEIALIADIHRIPFPAFHRGGHVFPADGPLNHALGLFHAQAVPGQGLPVPFEIQKVAAAGAFGKDAAGPLDRGQDRLDPGPDLLDGVQVRPGDLEPQGGFQPGAQHFDPALDRHGPGIGQTGDLQGFVHLGDQVFLGDMVRSDAAQERPWPTPAPSPNTRYPLSATRTWV